ncbi:MAG: hypothetical protein ACRCS9_02950 [Hyphomicrobium sp.]
MTKYAAGFGMDGRVRAATSLVLTAPAWTLWTTLARTDVMATSDDRDRMMERHRLVVAMIEVNSQQLRCDSVAAGLDIERLNAERDLLVHGDTQDTRAALTALEARVADNDAKKRKLAAERDWLDTSLREFDAQLDRAQAPTPTTKN